MVGFLVTGFVLNYLGIVSGEMLQKLADLGITLLLFTVGLKINPKVLITPQVWAVTALHSVVVTTVFGMIILGLVLANIPFFAELDLKRALLLGFALSFSSTVFVVKTLEGKGEMKSLHGRIAIGILVVQDLAAVLFLAASTGQWPSPWALLLLLLLPLRPLVTLLLEKTDHGELLILYGLVLALGGAEIFELGGVKDDLGALVMGMLISTHPKAEELAKSMLGFKDLFLLGFFLSIGMLGQFSVEALTIGLLLVPFIFLKSAFFFMLMTQFKLRVRTSLLATLSLSNYSEFGLIVVAIGVSNGWIANEWLVIMAVAVAISFVIAAPLTRFDDRIYRRFRAGLAGLERKERLAEDRLLDTSGATIAIFGMGRVGSGAYDKCRELYGDTVIGVDFDTDKISRHQQLGRKVLAGDPSDADFWDKIEKDHRIELVMLALPNLQSSLAVLEQLQAISFPGRVAATARYPDEEQRLRNSGATAVFNIYSEAGAGFAEHIRAG